MSDHEHAEELSSDTDAVSPQWVSSPIRNFRQVKPWLYRGGQPDLDDLKYLYDLDVRTVISLRWRRDVIEQERQAVAAFGMNYVSLPLNYWTFPSLAIIDKFLSILDDQEKRPVYVHCLHGSDRTGLLLAVYRMARDGWGADQAYREMKDCGFHLIRMFHFKWAVYRFERSIIGRRRS